MRKNRYTLFGYRLENGEIALHEREAEAVKLIYNEYLRGHSLQQIAVLMTSRGAPYNEASPVWNKHMVKRILDNPKYTGSAQYPALVTESEYDRVHLSKTEKYTRKAACLPAASEVLKEKAFCHECGSRFTRWQDSRYGEKWRCKNSGCRTDRRITDTMLIDGVIAAFNQVIADPSIIKETPAVHIPTLEVIRLQNEINRELGKTEQNPEYVKSLLMACAAEKYAGCMENAPAGRMAAEFENHHILTEFDTALFERTVEKLLIAKDGAVHIQLNNGQLLAQNPNEKGAATCLRKES